MYKLTAAHHTATTLAECPIGLFFFGDTLCLKTEYGNNDGRIDAYIVGTGEFFWGTSDGIIRRQRSLPVLPLSMEDCGNPAPNPPEKPDSSGLDCPCTKIEQEPNCPVGYPSLLCDKCDGKGVLPNPHSDLYEAVARKLWDVNCSDQTYDEALSGAKAGNYHDARAIEFIHDLADAAIAVVVERCAQVVDKRATIAVAELHESGASDRWVEQLSVARDLAKRIRALARKE